MCFAVIPRSSWNLLHLLLSVRDQRRIIPNAMDFEPFLQAGDRYLCAYKMLTYSIVRNSSRNTILLGVLQTHTTFRNRKQAWRDIYLFLRITEILTSREKKKTKSLSPRKGDPPSPADHMPYLRQWNYLQKQLNFSFLEVIRVLNEIFTDRVKV